MGASSILPCGIHPQFVELFHKSNKLKTHKNPFFSTLTKKNIIFTEITQIIHFKRKDYGK